MAHHFELIKNAQKILDENQKIEFEDFNQKLLTMQLMLKVADISNVSRPFEIADNTTYQYTEREVLQTGRRLPE